MQMHDSWLMYSASFSGVFENNTTTRRPVKTSCETHPARYRRLAVRGHRVCVVLWITLLTTSALNFRFHIHVTLRSQFRFLSYRSD